MLSLPFGLLLREHSQILTSVVICSPVIKTDNVYLYLLNSKYSRINSLINMFSLERLGLSSYCI